jgi:hypothetical protein
LPDFGREAFNEALVDRDERLVTVLAEARVAKSRLIVSGRGAAGWRAESVRITDRPLHVGDGSRSRGCCGGGERGAG